MVLETMERSKGEKLEQTGVPTWLEGMFAASKFYDPCEDNCSKPAKFYCTACMIIVCEDRMEQHHKSRGHPILTAYKSSGAAAFRIEDLKDLWDCSGIQRYKINGQPILYVNQKGGVRRSGSPSGGVKCGTCQYKISASSNFCSVECKVKDVLEKIEERKAEALNREKRKLEIVAGQSFRKRPRKQSTPRRAPLF